MFEHLITIIITMIASSGVWGFITMLYSSQHQKKTAEDKLLLALGREKLLCLSKSYIEKGYIPDDETDCFLHLREAYLECGGNSVVKKISDDAVKLPTHSKNFEQLLP